MALAGGSKVRVMVRPQNITASAGAANGVSGLVIDSMITGSLTKLYLRTPLAGDEPMVLSHPTSAAAAPPAVGSELAISWSTGDAIAVPEAR